MRTVHSLFSSHNKVNVRQNNALLPYVRYEKVRIVRTVAPWRVLSPCLINRDRLRITIQIEKV